MNALARMAVKALMFIQFRDVSTNAPLWQTDAEGNELKDADGNPMPVGVRCYGPGSKQYRDAEDAVSTSTIRDGKKGLTGQKVRENQTKIMARTITEFVGFEYEELTPNGKEPAEREAINARLLNDPAYIAVRDQIAEKQSDLGNSSASATTA